jgi:hypothetical protein
VSESPPLDFPLGTEGGGGRAGPRGRGAAVKGVFARRAGTGVAAVADVEADTDGLGAAVAGALAGGVDADIAGGDVTTTAGSAVATGGVADRLALVAPSSPATTKDRTTTIKRHAAMPAITPKTTTCARWPDLRRCGGGGGARGDSMTRVMATGATLPGARESRDGSAPAQPDFDRWSACSTQLGSEAENADRST